MMNANVKADGRKVSLPAGRYYVGDPCHVVATGDWGKWLDDAYDNDFDPTKLLLADINGCPVVGIPTAHGDGRYFDDEGNGFGVDSGLLGLVPWNVVDASKILERPWLGLLVDFKDSAECWSRGGTIHLGEITIYTGDEDGGVT